MGEFEHGYGWFRLGVGALVLALAVGILVAAAPWVTAHVVHAPDESAFTAYVRRNVDGWWSGADPGGAARDRRWAAAHPDLVVTEGHRACAWLARQPHAGRVDPSGRSDVGALQTRYLHATRRGAPAATLSRMGRRTVAAGAWAYLCWGDRRDRSAPRSLVED